MSRRLWRLRPAFHFPARGLKQIGRRGADITAAGNQDAWHQPTTGGDFDFLEFVRLNRPHLFQPDELEQGEKRDDDFDPRSHPGEQARKTAAKRPAERCRIRVDLVRDGKILSEDLAQILLRVEPLEHVLEGVDELKNPDFA